MTQMLILTSDRGLVATRTHNLVSSDAKEICDFLKNSGLTAGFSIQYAVHRDGRVVEVIKKGKLCQRDLKPLIEAGFGEWIFSWAFAGKKFRLDDGRVVEREELDLVKVKDVLPWARAFGQVVR